MLNDYNVIFHPHTDGKVDFYSFLDFFNTIGEVRPGSREPVERQD